MTIICYMKDASTGDTIATGDAMTRGYAQQLAEHSAAHISSLHCNRSVEEILEEIRTEIADGEIKIEFEEAEERVEKFTDAEFDALARNSDGDIITLSDAFIWLTDEQIDRLSGDDSARFEDMQEELRFLMADAIAEFG